jgi:hypothetical protein
MEPTRLRRKGKSKGGSPGTRVPGLLLLVSSSIVLVPRECLSAALRFRESNGRFRGELVPGAAGSGAGAVGEFGCEGAPLMVSSRANTYEGRAIAPGFQRAPDLPRALSIVREDYAKQIDFTDLFWIWTYEQEIGNGSAEAYRQISREMSEQSARCRSSSGRSISSSFMLPSFRRCPRCFREAFPRPKWSARQDSLPLCTRERQPT